MSKKRGSGEGHLRQRKDGRWEYQLTISYDPITGQAKRKSIYGKTQAEARRKFEKGKDELTKGNLLEPNNLTLEEWLNRWIYDYMEGHVAPVTFESYKYFIYKHIAPVWVRLS